MENEKFGQSQKIPREQHHAPPSAAVPRGVIKPKLVRNIAFSVITFSLVVCTVLCILAIWEFTKSDAVWRAVATFIVVSVATGIFTFVNEKLG